MTNKELKQFISDQLEEALSIYVGSLSSEVTAEQMRNTVLDCLTSMKDRGFIAQREFSVAVSMNGPKVDMSIVDPKTGEVLTVDDLIMKV